jgi:hypothetical protein
VSCHEASSAFAAASVDIPANAGSLSFDYRVGSISDGDYVALYLDDEPIWVLSASSVVPGDFISSGPVPIEGLSGRRTLTFALHGVGTPNATFDVRSLATVAAMPRLNASGGGNRVIEATGPDGAVATLDASGSENPDPTALTYSWTGPFGTTSGVRVEARVPLGKSNITLSVTDSVGGTASDTFEIDVRDTTAPVIVLPANIVTGPTSVGGAVVSYTATATDSVDGALVATCLPGSASTFPVGTTTVRCTATDAHNNSSQGSFTVTVKCCDFGIVAGPTVVDRGQKVTVTAFAYNLGTEVRSGATIFALTSSCTQAVVAAFPVLLQPGTGGQLSVPYDVPRTACTGTYTFTTFSWFSDGSWTQHSTPVQVR